MTYYTLYSYIIGTVILFSVFKLGKKVKLGWKILIVFILMLLFSGLAGIINFLFALPAILLTYFLILAIGIKIKQRKGEAVDEDKKSKVGCGIYAIAYPLLGITGFAIYIWTIVIAYESGGIGALIWTTVLPIIAQLIWFVKVWKTMGSVMNFYCISIISYIVLWIIMFIGASLMEEL